MSDRRVTVIWERKTCRRRLREVSIAPQMRAHFNLHPPDVGNLEASKNGARQSPCKYDIDLFAIFDFVVCQPRISTRHGPDAGFLLAVRCSQSQSLCGMRCSA